MKLLKSFLFATAANATVGTVPEPTAEAELCGACNKRYGCGDDSANMKCHYDKSRVKGVCVCHDGYGPNDTRTGCTRDTSDRFDINVCKEVKPNVYDRICNKECGQNQMCRVTRIAGDYVAECICRDGFEFDDRTRTCVDKDTGKCTRNTDCDGFPDNGEKCDRTGIRRCICRPGFTRVQTAEGQFGCVPTCGSYKTFNFHDAINVSADVSRFTPNFDTYEYAPYGWHLTGNIDWTPKRLDMFKQLVEDKCGSFDEDHNDVRAHHEKLACLKDLRIRLKPHVCGANATCETVTIFGTDVETCKCNDGFRGDGRECVAVATCDDYCERKVSGSQCVRPADPGTAEFRCRCPANTVQVTNRDRTTVCIEEPVCATVAECSSMGDAFCFNGRCLCGEGLVMGNTGQCVWDETEVWDELQVTGESDIDEESNIRSSAATTSVSDPCSLVLCPINSHCEYNTNLQGGLQCVCDTGYTGTAGDCQPTELPDRPSLIDEYCIYGSCLMDPRVIDELPVGNYFPWPDYFVQPGDYCGDRDMHLICGRNGCCGCDADWTNEDGERRNGCEHRLNPCENGTHRCEDNADCIPVPGFDPSPGPYTGIQSDFRTEITGSVTGGGDGVIDLPEPWGHAYVCKCRAPLDGHGFKPRGCFKPMDTPGQACRSIKNPCGRNSVCIDDEYSDYTCACEEGYRSKTGDGKHCFIPNDVVDPDDTERCHGFCQYSKNTKDTCHLRPLALHPKLKDYKVMTGDARQHSKPGVIMKVATKKAGFPLNRTPYTAFLEFDQVTCGNVLLGAMMSGDVDIAIFDRAGSDGRSVYRVDGVQGYLTKTKDKSRAWSGLVIQYTKTHKTLADLTGNPDDFEEQQFIKQLNDGSEQVKPDYDVFHLMLSGKDVTPDVMGVEKFKSCFNVRDGGPFDFVLWDERTEQQETDTLEDREKMKPLNGDYTKCYLYNKIKDRNIKDIVCKEPLVVNGETIEEKPTFFEMVQHGDKDAMACTETDP